MKRIKSFTLAALAVVIIATQTGCFGSFGLTKAVYKFNSKVGDKWVNEVVFLALGICQVYSITLFIDGFILNSIEFWTGSNPMAMAPGQVEKQNVSYMGKDYTLTATQNHMQIKCADASVKTTDLVYNPQTATWAMVQDGVSTNLMTYNADGTLTYYTNGTTKTLAAEYVKQMAGMKTLALQ